MLPVLSVVLGFFGATSILLLGWQWLVARRFPLHRSPPTPANPPAISLLKPLKGGGDSLAACLRSWLDQEYSGPVEMLLGVEPTDAAAIRIVEELKGAYPQKRITLVTSKDLRGPNLKMATLAKLEALANHETLVISDADVQAPPNLLNGLVGGLSDPGVGLVTCFYRLDNLSTLAMHWEAVAINADFWSQVLQSRTLAPVDFALGAVMALHRQGLKEAGGFEALEDYLADDFQLGNRIARGGHKIALCSQVVACRSDPVTWNQAWRHQLRWARTIRSCRPMPYFLSVLGNPTLWPIAWAIFSPTTLTVGFLAAAMVTRAVVVMDLEHRLTKTRPSWNRLWLAPLKDLLQFALWLGAFMGNRVYWRGTRMRVGRGGILEPGIESRSANEV